MTTKNVRCPREIDHALGALRIFAKKAKVSMLTSPSLREAAQSLVTLRREALDLPARARWVAKRAHQPPTSVACNPSLRAAAAPAAPAEEVETRLGLLAAIPQALAASTLSAGADGSAPRAAASACAKSLHEQGSQTAGKVYDHEEVAQVMETAVERATAQTREMCTQVFQVELESRLKDLESRVKDSVHGIPAFAVGDRVAIKGSSEGRRGNYKDGEGWGEVVGIHTSPIQYWVVLKPRMRKGNSEAVEDWFYADEIFPI